MLHLHADARVNDVEAGKLRVEDGLLAGLRLILRTTRTATCAFMRTSRRASLRKDRLRRAGPRLAGRGGAPVDLAGWACCTGDELLLRVDASPLPPSQALENHGNLSESEGVGNGYDPSDPLGPYLACAPLHASKILPVPPADSAVWTV